MVTGKQRLGRRVSPIPRPGAASSAIPDDVAAESVRRLGWVGLLFAVSYVFLQIAGNLLNPSMGGAESASGIIDRNTLLAAGMGMAVCGLAWSGRIAPPLMLDIGLIFEVAAALVISLAGTAGLGAPFEATPRGSTVSTWIVLFILAVPTSLGKTVLAGLLTAAMLPLGLAINLLAQNASPPPVWYWVALSLPTFVLAGWAILLSRFIYDLRAQVAQQREMGSYELTEVLGQGGMGEVWRGRHRLLERDAAIKLIPPGNLAGRTRAEASVLRQRFEREAQATAALRSPHTVVLYDFGVNEDGSFYYAMELLEGKDLWDMVTEFGPLPAERVVHLLRQACDSLAEAHARGLIHRDLKPTNLFACRMSLTYDFLKVLDFGLVKTDGDPDDTRLTRYGVTTGTPAYMAPEAALDSRAADARSDIYSLGCVAYWLVSGKNVFEDTSSAAAAYAHIHTTPLPPSFRSGLAIPEPLEELILRCLEKEPSKRPQSMLELDRLLGQCNTGGRWTPEDAERWWRQHLPQFTLIARRPD